MQRAAIDCSIYGRTNVKRSMTKATKRRNAIRKPALKSDADQRLAALKTIVSGLAAAIGPHCEIVLHDFRTPEKSIVAIGGQVTKRSVGGSMSQIGLSLLDTADLLVPSCLYPALHLRTRLGRRHV